MIRAPRPRKTAELSESLHQRLNMYALAASAAGVGLLALAPPAEAKIVYTPAYVTIPLNTYFFFDLSHDGLADFYFLRWSAFPCCTRLWIGPANHKNREYTGSNEIWGEASASALIAGERIGPRGRFHPRPFTYARMATCVVSSNGATCAGPWRYAYGRYLGLKFQIDGKFHYGWARLSVEIFNFKINAILTGYAYETVPNKSIIAGKTHGPDVTTVSPASLGHLAAGASAIPAWRLKQTAATNH